MKKIINGRQTGKTEKLIKLSADKFIPILTHNKQSALLINKRAREAGLAIPDPISVNEIMSDAYLRGISCIPKVIVDDAEYVLEAILRHRKVNLVDTISICNEDPSPASMVTEEDK